MPGWLTFILVGLLLLIGVVVVLLLLPDTEAKEGDAEEAWRAEVPAAPPRPAVTAPPPAVTLHPPAAAPPVKKQPPIVLRPGPAPEPKVFIGGRAATTPPSEFRPTTPPPLDNGSKMKVERVKVNLNVICRRTGRSMRVCSCEWCRKEREQLGL